MIYIKKYENFIGGGDHASYSNDSGDVFWGNLGAGMLPFSKSTKKFMVVFRSKYVNEPETWGIIGGKIDEDKNESIEQALKREFNEETKFDIVNKFNKKSYTIEDIELIHLYTFESEKSTFKYYNYMGLLEEEFIPILDWENDDYKWLSLPELINLDNKHFGLETLLNDKKTMNILKSL